MTDYIRRLVSGNKARFKDHELKLELDLVYVTDQVIIMGYPASGIEGLYRNRREDAIRFLESRHGKNYWVFNFCPLKENSYESDVFGGRVSRYPFPDHHAPPLAIMPLVAREMHGWLNGSPDRVAVLHCKAGKGRSGTMACSYLLSLNDDVHPPKLERSYSAKQWAARRMENAVDVLPPDEENQPQINSFPSTPFKKSPPPSDTAGILDVDSGSPPTSSVPNPEKSFTDALKGVLDLHTARRMKPPSEKEGKTKQGVSIPSQRRFLYYWALLLAQEAPKHMWAVQASDLALNAAPIIKNGTHRPKVLLTQLKLRMRETSSVKLNIVKAANLVIERTNMAKVPAGATAATSANPDEKEKKEKSSGSQVWASLARYDDDLVDLLEDWEVYTRDTDGHLGQRRPGSEHLSRRESTEEEVLSRVFETGKWDKGKMVRSFARLGEINTKENSGEKIVDEKEGKIHVYTLLPLSDKRWKGLKHELHKTEAHSHHEHRETLAAIDDNAAAVGVSVSEANSINDEAFDEAKKRSKIINPGLERGIILDAGREVRIKLYMGQVFMGWLWFIPTFHMPQPPPPVPSSLSPGITPPQAQSITIKSTFLLTRKEIDFPLGIGSAIIDAEIDMEWVVPAPTPAPPTPFFSTTPAAVDLVDIEPPMRSRTGGSQETEPEQSGLAAAVQVLVSGDEGETDGAGSGALRKAVEANQGDTV